METWFYISAIVIMGIFIVFWIIVLPLLKKRISKRNIDRQKDMLIKVKKGTKIILMGGIYAEFVRYDHNLAEVKIAEETYIKIDRNSIIGIVNMKKYDEKGKFIPEKRVDK